MKKEVFAGAGLGLLIGTIIGLSIAEVTGLILGALTSLLAAFFGLRSSKDGETGNQLVIGSFGVMCLLSIFLGLFIRSHNLFAPSLASEIAEYRAAQFDTAEIKKIILFKRFGLVPEGVSFSKDAAQLNKTSVLMSGDEKSLYLCGAIDETSTNQEMKEAFDNSGGIYKQIETELSAAVTDSTELRKTFLLIKKMICNSSN